MAAQQQSEHGYEAQQRGSAIAFGRKAEAITPSATDPIRSYKYIFCTTAGTIAMKGSDGVALPSMTFAANDVVPFVPTYVLVTGTAGTFWGVIE